jgi:hypothetical protein
VSGLKHSHTTKAQTRERVVTNSVTGMGMVALMAMGLTGCADTMAGHTTDHETMAVKHGEHSSNKMVWISKEDGEKVNYEIKVIPSDGADPIFVSTDDPESPEFQEALKKLEASGIVFNMDGHHKFMIEHMEGNKVLKFDDLDFEFDIEELKELEALAELEGLEGDHKIFVRKMHEGDTVIEFKNGHALMELEEGESEWVSEDGKLHIIKKLDDGEGEKLKVHKKIFIRKVTIEDENAEEKLEDEDLK